MVNGAIYPLPYDLVKDFEPIGLLSRNPLMIIGRKSLPPDDLTGLVAWLKANPEKATQGNPTAGGHVAGAYFQKETGTHFTFVPYRGAGPAMQDLVSGQIDLLIVQPAVALPQVRAGAIKAFASTGKARLAVASEHRDRGGGRAAQPRDDGMVRAVRTQGDAEGDHRQAQRAR